MTQNPKLAVSAGDHESSNAIYYIDDAERIAWTNAAFARFAAENGAPNLPAELEGADLLNSFSGGHQSRWRT
ncbi:MAG: hypothetical protein ABI579_08785, partial [Candidatus Sumerlaeota bacterium]